MLYNNPTAIPILIILASWIILAFSRRLGIAAFRRRAGLHRVCQCQKIGAVLANTILHRAGLSGCIVIYDDTLKPGQEFYYSTRGLVVLSHLSYYSKTLAAHAIAAHECAHAAQDAEHCPTLRWMLRSDPFRVCSKLSVLALLAGAWFTADITFLWFAIIPALIYAATTAALASCEANASDRAIAFLKDIYSPSQPLDEARGLYAMMLLIHALKL